MNEKDAIEVIKKRLSDHLDLVLNGTVGSVTETIGPFKVKVYRVYSFLLRIDVLHKDKKPFGKEKKDVDM